MFHKELCCYTWLSFFKTLQKRVGGGEGVEKGECGSEEKIPNRFFPLNLKKKKVTVTLLTVGDICVFLVYLQLRKLSVQWQQQQQKTVRLMASEISDRFKCWAQIVDADSICCVFSHFQVVVHSNYFNWNCWNMLGKKSIKQFKCAKLMGYLCKKHGHSRSILYLIRPLNSNSKVSALI